MSMMNKGILQVCLSPAWGGIEMVVFETALKLQTNGFVVTTVCPPGSPLQNKLVEAGLPTIGAFRRHKYFAPSVIKTVRTALKTGRYSVVLIQQTSDIWQVVPALWKMPEIKLVVISHSFLVISKRDWLHGILYGRVNSMIALSEIHKRNLLQWLPVKSEAMEVVPNSIDPVKFNPGQKRDEIRNQYKKSPDEMLIGVCARLDLGKGLMPVIAVADQLKKWNVKFQICFFGSETVGESGAKAALETEIRKLGLRDCVQLAGHRSDIENVIASLDVLLMPSPAETFGRVIIEAMASGVPVVASAGGSVPSIVEHQVDGLLVKPLDPEAMAAAIRWYYDYPEKKKRIIDKAMTVATEQYHYEKVDRKLYGILGLN
jgi:glycosyltransferase involved in cell wall biosynthesis